MPRIGAPLGQEPIDLSQGAPGWYRYQYGGTIRYLRNWLQDRAKSWPVDWCGRPRRILSFINVPSGERTRRYVSRPYIHFLAFHPSKVCLEKVGALDGGVLGIYEPVPGDE